MIDRISRAYVNHSAHYSAYRQPTSTHVSNSNYVENQIHSTPTQSGRAITAPAHFKKSMEHSLVRAEEASNRIKSTYSPVDQTYTNIALKEGYPYMGLNIDIKA